MLPGGPIGGEDALSQKRVEGSLPALSEAPLLEIDCLDGLQVLRLDGLVKVSAEDNQLEGSEFGLLETSIRFLEQSVILEVSHVLEE
jgi:hypothetical protein